MRLHHIYLSFTLALVVCFSCEKTEGNLEIDNASEEDTFAVIDGISYPIRAGGRKVIEIEPGLHQLQVKSKDGKVKEETSFTINKGGLLNLGLSDYYIWTDFYGVPELRANKIQEDWVTIGKQKFFGDFMVLPKDQYYVERRWDYGLAESFPSTLYNFLPKKEKYMVRSKLFRVDELVTTYMDLASKSSAPQ